MIQSVAKAVGDVGDLSQVSETALIVKTNN